MAESFQQRIELQGVEDILAKLRALGGEGTAAFSKLKTSIETANPALQKLSTVSQQTQLQITQLGNAFSQFSSVITPFSAGLGGVVSVIGTFAGPAGILAAVTGLVAFVRSAADSIVALERQGRALGLTQAQFAALRRVAKEAGLSTDELGAALTRLSREVEKEAQEQFKSVIDLAKRITTELPGGSVSLVNFADLEKLKVAISAVAPQLQQAFKNIGSPLGTLPIEQFSAKILQIAKNTDEAGLAMRRLIDSATNLSTAVTPFEKLDDLITNQGTALRSLRQSFLDAKGNQVSTFEALQKVVDGLAKLPDGLQKTAQASKIFGRTIGPELLQALSEGRNGIDQIINSLEQQGVVVDRSGIQKAKELKKAFVDLESSGNKLKNDLVIAFGPVITDSVNALTEAASNLKKQFDGFSLKAFDPTNISIKIDKEKFLAPINLIGDAIRSAADASAQSINATFAHLADSLLPIWERVKAAAVAAWEFIKNSASSVDLSAIGRAILDAARNSAESIRSTLGNLGDDLARAFNRIPELAQAAWDAVKNGAQGAWDFVQQSALSIDLSSVWEALKTSAQAAFDNIRQLATTAFQSIASSVSSVFSGLSETIVSPFRTAANTILSLFDGVIARIKSAFSTISSSAAEGLAAGTEANSPGFASGGFVWGPGTETSDSILARLSRGEFVINARAVAHFGRDFFAALNRMRVPSPLALPKFALGGMVDGMQRSLSNLLLPGFAQGGFVDMTPVPAGRSLHPVTLNFSNFTGSISGLRESSDTVERLMRASVEAQVRSGGTKPDWYR